MITPNHGLSGYICGRALMPILRRVSPLSERSMGWAFFVGAMLPDIDIITKVIGGRAAYFSGAFYAHRHASHSLLGGAVLALMAAFVLYRPLTGARIWPRHRQQEQRLRPWAKLWFVQGSWWGAVPWWKAEGRGFAGLVLCLWLGTMLHLVGDFFTPGWPLPIFWPFPERWGGLRHIGWFTPYIFWLFLATIGLAWSMEALRQRIADRHPIDSREASSGVFSSESPRTVRAIGSWRERAAWLKGASWVLYGVAVYRWVEFMVVSRYESSSQWHSLQRQLLPEAMIVPVTDGVRTVWFWLTG